MADKPKPKAAARQRGYRTDQASSARHLSPSQPYTGDGKTSRDIYDAVRVIFKLGRKS